MRLPPRFVHVPAAVVYAEPPLASPLVASAVRLYGLAWGQPSSEQAVVTVTVDELGSVLNLSRRQMFAHLRSLSNRGVLQYTYRKDVGLYVLAFPAEEEWPQLYEGGDMSAENRTHLSLPAADPFQSQGEVRQLRKESAAAVGSSLGGSVRGGEQSAKFCTESLAVLDRVGVREPARSELAQACDPEYLEAWVTWFERQSDLGVAGLVCQLRAGAPAPDTRSQSERLINGWVEAGART